MTGMMVDANTRAMYVNMVSRASGGNTSRLVTRETAVVVDEATFP